MPFLVKIYLNQVTLSLIRQYLAVNQSQSIQTLTTKNLCSMKNLLLVLIVVLGFGVSANAQVKFGIKAGMTSTDLSPSTFRVTNQEQFEEFKIAVNDANYGATAGVFMLAEMGAFYIMPEALFHSNSVNFTFEDVTRLRSEVFKEKYQTLDVPVTFGLNLGPLRLGAGPVGHVLLNGSSTLDDPNVSQKYDDFTLGWQAGAGLDIWRLVFDFRWEGNFSKFGNTMTVAGESVQFDQTPGRMIATVGWKF